jgi:hypothetical protein
MTKRFLADPSEDSLVKCINCQWSGLLRDTRLIYDQVFEEHIEISKCPHCDVAIVIVSVDSQEAMFTDKLDL